TATNAACCALFPVLENIQGNMFVDDNCSDVAHTAPRVAFHATLGEQRPELRVSNLILPCDSTGMDGSIFIFSETELSYAASIDIADAFNLKASFIQNHNISVADVKCPGILQPPFIFGNVNATFPAPNDTVPEPFQTVDVLLASMADTSFSPAELAALLAS
ncbi:heme peroxidase, partial [Mycena galopus ATCC 62051]